jgi:phosphohistidine swiveling domain-containing protein
MAVLVQPRIVPVVAGLARVQGAIVEIDAVAGSPAALMAGWATGQRIEVTDDDEVRAPEDCLLDTATARDVGALARRSLNLLGHGVIEWAWTGSSVVLLQSGAAEDRDQAAPAPDGVAGLDRPAARRVARLAVAFPGQLCDELVLPWALGMRDPDGLIGSTSTAIHDFSITEVRNAAGRLEAQVWGLSVADAVRESGALLRELRGSEPEAALDRLDLLAEPNMAAAMALLGGLRSVGTRAVQARRLHRADDIFGCALADLSDTRTGEPRQSWKGGRRWEPFLVGVAQTLGTAYHGIPASRGVGAGRARIVADPHAIPAQRRPREIIVAPTPVPALSSQLWDAAGLVTTGGSAAAHLMEVARSLGVPAVAACALPFSIDSLEGALLAVDGERGVVSHWPM